MLRRFLALAFGVVVIAGAISIRDNNDRGADPGTVAEVDPYQVFEDHEVSVLCAEELVILCERLESFVTSTRVEPAWQTVDRLAAGDDLGADRG